MTDYKALCKELTNELHGYASANPYHDSDELVARAGLALAAEPEPPAYREVAGLVAWLHGQDGGIDRRATYSRIADLLSRLAPQPVVEGPTDEHILRLAREWNSGYESIEFEFISDFARAVLARWGHLAAEPVPPVEGENV